MVTAQFVLGDNGLMRCSGSFVGAEVIIGTAPSGPASGVFTCRGIAEAEVPADIPKP